MCWRSALSWRAFGRRARNVAPIGSADARWCDCSAWLGNGYRSWASARQAGDHCARRSPRGGRAAASGRTPADCRRSIAGQGCRAKRSVCPGPRPGAWRAGAGCACGGCGPVRAGPGEQAAGPAGAVRNLVDGRRLGSFAGLLVRPELAGSALQQTAVLHCERVAGRLGFLPKESQPCSGRCHPARLAVRTETSAGARRVSAQHACGAVLVNGESAH